MIELHIQLGELIIKGETYQHRALLKHLRFKWSPEARLWHRTVGDQDLINYIVKMLEVNDVNFTADKTVRFDLIDKEVMRSIRSAMDGVREKL